MSSPQTQADERRRQEERRRRQEGESQKEFKQRRALETQAFKRRGARDELKRRDEAKAQAERDRFKSRFTPEQRDEIAEASFKAYRDSTQAPSVTVQPDTRTEAQKRFDVIVEQRQREGGTGEFARGKSRDVERQRIQDAEARTQAERELVDRKIKQAGGLTARRGGEGTTRRFDESRGRFVTSISGERPVVTKEEIESRAARKIERTQGRQIGPRTVNISAKEQAFLERQKGQTQTVIYGTTIVGGPDQTAEERQFRKEAKDAGLKVRENKDGSLTAYDAGYRGRVLEAKAEERQFRADAEAQGLKVKKQKDGTLIAYDPNALAAEKEARRANFQNKKEEEAWIKARENEGLVVSKYTDPNTGETKLLASEVEQKYNPNLAEQATGGVRYVGKAIGGLITLGAGLEALYTEKVLGRKDVADKIYAEGELTAQKVEKGLGYEGLASGARFLEPIVGKERTERAAKRYEELAKTEKDAVIGSGFGVAVAGTQVLIPGATGGQEELRKQEEAFKERPLEAGLATVVDIGTFAVGGGKPKGPGKGKVVERGVVDYAESLGRDTKTFTASKSTAEKGFVLGASKSEITGTGKGKKITTIKDIDESLARERPDTSFIGDTGTFRKLTEKEKATETRRVKVEKQRLINELEKTTETTPRSKEIIKRIKESDTYLKNIKEDKVTTNAPKDTDEVVSRTGQVSVLEPKVLTKEKPKIEESKSDIPEGFLPPEERTQVSSTTLGFGDSTAVIEARIADQSGKYFRTPKGIRRFEERALRDRQLTRKQRKTEQILKRPRARLQEIRDRIQEIRDRLQDETLTPEERAELQSRLQELIARREQLVTRIQQILERRRLKRQDFFGARQRVFQEELLIARSPGEKLTQKKITRQSAPGFKVSTTFKVEQATTPRVTQRQDFLQTPKQTTKQKPKQAQQEQFRFDTLTKQTTLTGQRFRTRQAVKTKTKTLTKQERVARQRSRLKASPIIFPGGGVSDISFRPYRKPDASEVSNLAVANILFGELSIRGTGEQKGGAEALLGDFMPKKGKKSRKKYKDILSI